MRRRAQEEAAAAAENEDDEYEEDERGWFEKFQDFLVHWFSPILCLVIGGLYPKDPSALALTEMTLTLTPTLNLNNGCDSNRFTPTCRDSTSVLCIMVVGGLQMFLSLC